MLIGTGNPASSTSSRAFTHRDVFVRLVQLALLSAGRRKLKAKEVKVLIEPLVVRWNRPGDPTSEYGAATATVNVARDGSVTDVDVLRTTGQTASNRPQVKLHQEQAVRAVRLCLQSYADVLDRTRQSGVGDTSESTSGIIL